MHNIIMQALVTGAAEWIKAVFQTAAKKGLVILVLSGFSIGGVIAIIHLLAQAEQMRREFKMEIKQEIADVRNEYRKQIADLNLRIEACEDERIKLKVRVAQLERRR